MRFFTVTTTLFAALAYALPQGSRGGSEDVKVKDFILHRDFIDGKIKIINVSFRLDGESSKDITCQASGLDLPSNVSNCGKSSYRFSLNPGKDSDFAIRIYRNVGMTGGYSGSRDIPTQCHGITGGRGPNDAVCNHGEDSTTIQISSRAS